VGKQVITVLDIRSVSKPAFNLIIRFNVILITRHDAPFGTTGDTTKPTEVCQIESLEWGKRSINVFLLMHHTNLLVRIKPHPTWNALCGTYRINELTEALWRQASIAYLLHMSRLPQPRHPK
jgi:hypothetical protein